jgi:type IV pilus assembly protein PilW
VPLDGTDVIAVRVPIRGSRAMRLETTMGGATADPDVPDAAPPTAGQILMLTDCNANVTSTFQMTGWAAGAVVHTATGASPGNATADLGYIFQEGARVLPVQTIIYYVANNAAGQPGLWRQVGANASEEMIVGVQGLQIVYGEDTTADRVADQYVAADVISDWANVISVSVSLLVRSEEASGTETDTVTYDLLGTVAGPFNDNFQRMQFNTTAALRNRAL